MNETFNFRSMSKKVTKSQLELMITFLEIHPYLISEKTGKNYTKIEKQKKWSDLTIILNEAIGPSKGMSDWKKTWRDWHYYTRVKAAKINKCLHEAEGEPKVREYLSPLEERVLALYRKVALSGSIEVQDGYVDDIYLKPEEGLQLELNSVITSTHSDLLDQQEEADDSQIASTSTDSNDQQKDTDEYHLGKRKSDMEEIMSNQNDNTQHTAWITATKEKEREMLELQQHFYNKKLEMLERQTTAAEKRAAAAERKISLLSKIIKLKERKECIKRITRDRTIRMKRLDYL